MWTTGVADGMVFMSQRLRLVIRACRKAAPATLRADVTGGRPDRKLLQAGVETLRRSRSRSDRSRVAADRAGANPPCSNPSTAQYTSGGLRPSLDGGYSRTVRWCFVLKAQGMRLMPLTCDGHRPTL